MTAREVFPSTGGGGPTPADWLCPRCGHTVQIAWTATPLHDGHANIPDPELVCMEVACGDGVCAATHLPHEVMRARLLRGH